MDVESYNVELEDDEGFIGDRASYTAFRKLLEDWRKAMRKSDEDPFGDKDSKDIPKRRLDASLADGDAEAGGIVQGAIEDFAQEFAMVIANFSSLRPGAMAPPWECAIHQPSRTRGRRREC